MKLILAIPLSENSVYVRALINDFLARGQTLEDPPEYEDAICETTVSFDNVNVRLLSQEELNQLVLDSNSPNWNWSVYDEF